MNFKEFFTAACKTEEPIGVIMRFNIRRSEYPNSHYIFVEGPSDKKFYSSTKVSKLQTDLYFYSVRDDFEDNNIKIVGKDAVLRCYSFLKERDDLESCFKRCIFIIDRDYDPEINTAEVRLSQEDKKRLCMTYGHSFENYFFEKENLRELFYYYDMSEKALNEYWEHFTLFSEKASKFFSALATVTYFFRVSEKKYIPRYKVEDIFFNDVFVDEGIDSKLFRLEYQKMMESIQINKKHMEYYKETKKEIEKAPGLYIRGHNCYYHLEQYLAKKHKVFLEADYRKLPKRFNIEFDGYDLQTQ